MSSALAMASMIFCLSIAGHPMASPMSGTRPIRRSSKSSPCGGRAILTRRRSRFHLRAHSKAAASPGSSPSARTVTVRMPSGRSSVRKPEVESAAQAVRPVACMVARQVSMPSPTINASPRVTQPHRAATAGA